MGNHMRYILTVIILLICSLSSFAQDLKRQGSFGVQFAPVTNAVKAQFRLTNEQGIVRQGWGKAAMTHRALSDDLRVHLAY